MDADLDGELSMLLASLIDARSHNRTPDLAKDLASFIQARVSMICGLLGIEGNHVSFVTVRSSFRKDQLYLRPIFSFPTALSNYFDAVAAV